MHNIWNADYFLNKIIQGPSSNHQTVATGCFKGKSIMQLSPMSQSIVNYVEQRMSTGQDNNSNSEDKTDAENRKKENDIQHH